MQRSAGLAATGKVAGTPSGKVAGKTGADRARHASGWSAMISIAMLAGGADAAGYYLERQAGCPADYYTDERETAGRWIGRGAQALDLSGQVAGDAGEVFAGLLAGRLPDGSVMAAPVMRADPRGLLPARPLVDAIRAQAVAHALEPVDVFADAALRRQFDKLAARIDTAGRKDPTVDAGQAGDLATAAGLDPQLLYPAGVEDGGYAAALSYTGRKVDRRRAGLDVTVSAPKSVSTLYALGDQTVAAQVTAAHEVAVSEALAYVEAHCAHGLRGHQGGERRAERIGTDGLLAAAFTHRTSRADDPQLHTHLVVANLVRGVDGRWSAVDSRALFRYARTAGAVYQSVLRGQLTRRLGVAWGPVHKSVAEIVGVPEEVCREFSTRRRQIEAALDPGVESRAARQRAAYRTRPAKPHTGERLLRDRWAGRVAGLGHDPTVLVAGVLDRTRTPDLPEVAVLGGRLFGPDGVTAQATSFTRRDLLRAVADSLPPGCGVTADRLEHLAGELLTFPDVVPLLPADAGGERRYTTVELLRTEQRALGRAAEPRPPVGLTPAELVAAYRAHGLSLPQGEALVDLLTGDRAVSVLVGPAGSGKTATLAAARDCWQQAGHPVMGAALAAVTAQRLQDATAIPAQSLARLLAAADRVDPATGRPAGLPPRVVVCVDEASMVGTRQLARLLDHLHAADGQAVLVGDPAQLPEIDAGGLFAVLTRRPGAARLDGNVRQIHGWERDALHHLRTGQVDQALDAYLVHDRVHLAASPARLVERIATDYTRQTAEHGPYAAIVLTSRRADVATLNGRIRARLQSTGRLGADTVTVGDRDGHALPLAAGELVMVTRNDQATGLFNGTRAQITSASRDVVALQTEDGRALTVPTGWAHGRLTHAYALTVHKGQGLTTGVALLYGTGALCQQAGYVAMSRGRDANHLYTAIDPGEADHDHGFRLAGGADPTDVLDALADRLTYAPRQQLASHQVRYRDAPWQATRDSYDWLNQPDSRDRGYGIER